MCNIGGYVDIIDALCAIWLYYVDINVYKPPILIATYLVIDVVADKAT